MLEAANISFGLNPGDLEVDLISRPEFLLKFRIPALRNLVLTSHSPLMVGRNCLGIMPWTRQRWASTARMIYRVRFCIEGIPRHVWQVSTVAKLFDPATMIEGIDENQLRDEEESACFYLWVWSCNPDALAKSGTLRIEEPLLPPESAPHYPELGIYADPVIRNGPADQLKYNVIIHVDEVWDYFTPKAVQNSFGIYDSNDFENEAEQEWPEKHIFS